jgi:hypothetical protein
MPLRRIQVPLNQVIKIGLGKQKLMGRGGFTDTQTAWRSHKPTLGKKADNRAVWYSGNALDLYLECIQFEYQLLYRLA